MGFASDLDLRACWVLCNRLASANQLGNSGAALCRDQPVYRAKWCSQLRWICVILYRCCCLLSLPIASLLIGRWRASGWPSIGLIVVAATAGASLLFIAAQGLFRDVLRARAGPFFAKLEAGFAKNAFSYLLFLRLMPVAPFWAVNILPAFSGMRLAQFIGATAIGIIPGTSIYVAVGRGFDHLLARGETPNLAVLNTRTSGYHWPGWRC